MSFSKSFDDDTVMSEINMTPLVDVMLVLLIIFILSMPVVTQSIDIELPDVTQEVNQTSEMNDIEISVAESGEIYWNGHVLNQEELRSKARTLAESSPNPIVKLKGHRAVEYQHIVSVMSVVREEGLTKLAFVAQFVDNN